MYNRILLTLDGSTLAEQALPYAIAQAEHFQAELVLLQVIEAIPEERLVLVGGFEHLKGKTVSRCYKYLKHIADCVEDHGIQVKVTIVKGHPYESIVKFAEANQIDLIVMCTRGHSGFSHWLMGSVVDRVVRGANIPVLLVRARKEEMGE